ncbi:lanosterol synthase [Didymella exigua CBS 183.55]|uniref:Terpene cyclase/mutase family member n=1 Tax=Didymella exigua CBS 183.55 TaxID=1150837 RepID=A0A6A5RMI1_9PLEO|nr:lanosterol synthase [Didymella exigua CBS 183.55]KAF1928204.1 lanosterol synthase [Didymella exigua CBS 183.55]
MLHATNGSANGATSGVATRGANGAQVPIGVKSKANGDAKTDYTRWRLRDDRGCQTWHYLQTEEEVKAWPQSAADRYFLGMETGLPELPNAKTPLEAAENGLSFFSKLQLPPGNWACEYGGPMFLLPGLVITWYVTETPIPAERAIEIKNYLFARAHPEDGGWGLHIEGESSVFGTSMNYTVLRLLGVDAEDPRMQKARSTLWKLGGATQGPHWAKFWLSVLGVMDWEIVNPVPPELWLLPDWVPISPWRWWIHMRQVFLPMSFVYSRRWSYPLNDLTQQLRLELLTKPYETINFAAHRNDISPMDDYHPKTWILKIIFWLVVVIWNPYLRAAWLVERAEKHVWWLIQAEDKNTDFSNLGPVNGPMNALACYVKEGPDSHGFQEHLKTLPEFLWIKDEGMLMNGTNGVQTWDTAFTVLAADSCDFVQQKKYQPMFTKALEFLEDQQMLEEVDDQALCYRQQRKGAWGFSTRKQGYTVSDCTSEGLKAVLILQNDHHYPTLIEERRLKDAIDVLLTMQNASGGCASYEPTRGSKLLEHLNAAEVFGSIMVEYDYVECTTATVTALQMFQKHYPSYRRDEIIAFRDRAVDYIRSAQRPDGSWYGAWGICFTYAAMFAMESLKSVGETYENSERVRKACKFFLDRQMEDGGWGETYKSCETGKYCQHEQSQVVQTAWVVIAMLEGEFPDKEPLRRALKMIMGRQQKNGEWKQEAIEGVFNKSCMISYPNYKFIFPIKALGMYAKRFGNEPL